jgi:hypothetical protein
MDAVQQKYDLMNCHCHRSGKNDYCDFNVLSDASLIYADHPVILFVGLFIHQRYSRIL